MAGPIIAPQLIAGIPAHLSPSEKKVEREVPRRRLPGVAVHDLTAASVRSRMPVVDVEVPAPGEPGSVFTPTVVDRDEQRRRSAAPYASASASREPQPQRREKEDNRDVFDVAFGDKREHEEPDDEVSRNVGISAVLDAAQSEVERASAQRTEQERLYRKFPELAPRDDRELEQPEAERQLSR